MRSKHDDLVKSLEERLRRNEYKSVHTFKNYWAGEIDLFCLKKNYVLVFEMKSNDTKKGRRKAYEQLDRSEKLFFSKNHRTFKFYVYWDRFNDGEYVVEWYHLKK